MQWMQELHQKIHGIYFKEIAYTDAEIFKASATIGYEIMKTMSPGLQASHVS